MESWYTIVFDSEINIDAPWTVIFHAKYDENSPATVASGRIADYPTEYRTELRFEDKESATVFMENLQAAYMKAIIIATPDEKLPNDQKNTEIRNYGMFVDTAQMPYVLKSLLPKSLTQTSPVIPILRRTMTQAELYRFVKIVLAADHWEKT